MKSWQWSLTKEKKTKVHAYLDRVKYYVGVFEEEIGVAEEARGGNIRHSAPTQPKGEAGPGEGEGVG